MTSPSLFDLPESRVADTSLDAYAKLLPTLRPKEIAVFLALCDYCEQTGWSDASGFELANFMGTFPTTTRPRLTGLLAKGYVEKTPTRRSRVTYESSVHGYRPVLSRAAVERARISRNTEGNR